MTKFETQETLGGTWALLIGRLPRAFVEVIVNNATPVTQCISLTSLESIYYDAVFAWDFIKLL